MSGRTLPPGTLGRVSTKQLPNGSFEASAWLRDHQCNDTRLRLRGATAEEAETAVRNRAMSLLSSAPHKITADMTVAKAVDAWLIIQRTRKELITPTTLDRYESWGNDLKKSIGRMTIRQLATPGDCDAVIMKAGKVSRSNAAITKKTLSMLLGTAARHGAILTNPVRDTERLVGSAQIRSSLDGAKFRLLLEWVAQWRLDQLGGVQPDRELLADAMRIAMGTSARPGEVLAIRRSDIAGDFEFVSICGTIVYTKEHGVMRKSTPKHSSQSRVVAVPEFARGAMRRRAAMAPPGHDVTLFATASGRPRSGSNLQRLIRSFRDDHEAQIVEELGIPVEEFTWKLFRRTAATQVDAEAGIDLAAGLLGHADIATTRRHYAVKLPEVNPKTAEILDSIFGTPPAAPQPDPDPDPTPTPEPPAPEPEPDPAPDPEPEQADESPDFEPDPPLPSNVIPFRPRRAS